MANTLQAKKRARQSEKRRQHNVSLRTMMRTYIKKVLSAIAAGDKTMAQTNFIIATSVIDKMANKRIIHKNKANRHKKRLSAHIKKMLEGEQVQVAG